MCCFCYGTKDFAPWCNFCMQQQVCQLFAPFTPWQSCQEMFLIVLTTDLHESFFANCFASLSNRQHLILECKNQLDMHYLWNFIIKHNREGLSKGFSGICSHHYLRLLGILLPSLLPALQEELQDVCPLTHVSARHPRTGHMVLDWQLRTTCAELGLWNGFCCTCVTVQPCCRAGGALLVLAVGKQASGPTPSWRRSMGNLPPAVHASTGMSLSLILYL